MNARKSSLVAAICLAAVAGGVLLAARHWPFTRSAVEKSLAKDLHAKVTIGKFHMSFFPHPGCVAEQVHAFNDGFDLTVERLNVEGAYSAFIRGAHELERIRVVGGTAHFRSRDEQNGTATPVKEFIIERSVFERVASKPGEEPLRIGIHRLVIQRPTAKAPIVAEGTGHYPKPDGELWIRVRLDKLSGVDTPLAGEYKFEHAQLGVFEGIAGALTSRGKFAGPLRQVAVDGQTEVPDFQVTRSEHPVRLEAGFHALVDATNGDTLLEPIETAFAGTRIRWSGGVRGEHGKTAALDMTSDTARIQDLLFLVLHSDQPSMTGPITFRAKVVLPPDGAKFIERVQLDGDFGIHGQFSNPSSRKNVAELSERARGDKEAFDDPGNVLSDLRGHVRLRGGVAHLTGVSFRVPGAVASLAGTYDLVSRRVNLHGQLKTEASLSNTTRGVKSFLLKAVDPFFKRKNAGAVIPVSVTGVYPHPVYSALGLHKGE